jgi:hypothetical protein
MTGIIATRAPSRGARTGYCRKDAFARFPPLVPVERRPCRCSCTSGAVDYGPNATRASDGSVARYYDPSTGEFLSLDPAVAHTEAPFNYAIDDPVNVADPSGEGVECFVTLGFFGCPSKQVQQANILIKALRQLESTLCMEAGNDESYANSTVAQAAQSTLSYVSDFLLCAGDEFAGGDIVDILSGCLKGQVAGELIDQLNQDSGLSQLAVNFLLDPVGTLLNELSSVFTLAAQVFVKVGLALQYNPATDYELNYVQNGVPYFIIIPKNL